MEGESSHHGTNPEKNVHSFPHQFANTLHHIESQVLYSVPAGVPFLESLESLLMALVMIIQKEGSHRGICVMRD